MPLSKLPTEILEAQVGAKISLSQVVAVLIERWDELAEGVKAEIAKLLRRGCLGDQTSGAPILCFYIQGVSSPSNAVRTTF